MYYRATDQNYYLLPPFLKIIIYLNFYFNYVKNIYFMYINIKNINTQYYCLKFILK